MGLKPLQPDSEDEGGKDKSKNGKGDEVDDPLQNQEEKAAINYAKYQEDLIRKKEEEEIRQRIAKCVKLCEICSWNLLLILQTFFSFRPCRAQNKRELNRKLKGPTLGDAESFQSAASAADASGETLRWVKAAKRKAKEIAAKRLQEETEAEELAAATAAKYDSEDLVGLRVAHDMDDIDLEAGGEGKVLTLKDSKILDDGDDELLDSALEASEKDRINAERKKGVKKYTGLDDEEFRADQVGRKKSVLSKYDNDIQENGIKKDDGGFRLGGDSMSRSERDEMKKQQTEQMLSRTLLDLDYTKNMEVSDYLQEGDVGFKKPKTKKKKRGAARVRLDDDDEGVQQPSVIVEDTVMAEVDHSNSTTPASRRQVRISETIVDDDDLALSLAKARREKAKKVFKKMTPEMIARNLAAQREAEEAERLVGVNGSSVTMDGVTSTDPLLKKEEEGDGIDAELIFDDTSEFVRNINEARQVSPDSTARLQRRAAAAESTRRQQQEAQDQIQIKQEPDSPPFRPSNDIDGNALLQRATTMKEEESDEEMYDGNADDLTGAEEGQEEEDASVAAEPLVSGGMAAALSLLRQQGLLTEVTAEQKERERKQKEYDAWLATRRFEDRLREAELAASKAQGSAKDQATREYENRMRELEDARRAQEKFKNYTPDIDIKYTDEFGRTLNPHESWKRLSHVFHGKMPGQKKQEQRLQRIMDERKREMMLAGDTPSGMTRAFSERAERSGQAHMVLGIGSKNNAPQDIGLLGPNTVFKSKEKGKAKERSKPQSNGGTTSAIPSNGLDSSITGITSMIPRSTTTKSKAGFAPVKNSNLIKQEESPASPLPDTQTTAPSKFKLAFNKRPASDANSQPPTKHVKMEGVQE